MSATHKIIASITGATLLVSLGIGISFWSFRQIEEASSARRHTNLIINNANQLLSALKDAETGQRGYLLTDDEKFLEPYLAVSVGINTRLEVLRAMTITPSAR